MEKTENKSVAVIGQAAVGTETLDLFQFSTPSAITGSVLVTKQNKADDGKVKSLSLTIKKRSDIAKSLGVKSKDAKVTAEIRKATDLMLQMGVAELNAGIAAGRLTGGRISKSANGRLTVSAITPEKRVVTEEELAAALATMTDAERAALVAKVQELAKNAGAKTIDAAPEAEAAGNTKAGK